MGSERVELHQWYAEKPWEDGDCVIFNGVVTGHAKLENGQIIHTSKVESTELNMETEELIVKTHNSTYYCPLAYCNFGKQDKNPDLVANYESLKAAYTKLYPRPSIEDGNILLVLADFCEFFFQSMYYKAEGAAEPVNYYAYAQVGTDRDSYLVQAQDNSVELRYFPHPKNIEISTDGLDKPLWIENVGYSRIYARTNVGVLTIEPGERKQVTMENARSGADEVLPDGNLYPGRFV